MRRGQVAQHRRPGLPETSSACVIMPSEGRSRSPGQRLSQGDRKAVDPPCRPPRPQLLLRSGRLSLLSPHVRSQEEARVGRGPPAPRACAASGRRALRPRSSEMCGRAGGPRGAAQPPGAGPGLSSGSQAFLDLRCASAGGPLARSPPRPAGCLPRLRGPAPRAPPGRARLTKRDAASPPRRAAQAGLAGQPRRGQMAGRAGGGAGAGAGGVGLSC